MGEKTYLLGTDAVLGYLKENPSLFYFTNAEKKGQLALWTLFWKILLPTLLDS